MTRLVFVAALLAGWLLLWGDLSIANILSGLVLIGFLLVVFPTGRPDRGALAVRPVALGRFLGGMVADLVRSNLTLARIIVGRRRAPHSGVIAVELDGCSAPMLAFVTNALALSPGTMAVATTLDPPTVYVHVLQLDDAEATRAEVQALARRAIAAFGTAGAGGAAGAAGAAGPS